MSSLAVPDSSPHVAPVLMSRLMRRRSRWWLAGLLVGCLLPAGLVHAEAMRMAERLTQICLMAPAAIRAESRRVAHRKAWRSLTKYRVLTRAAPIAVPRVALKFFCADLDVLNRRGPPRPGYRIA